MTLFSSKRLRFGCALAAALLLAGCDTFQTIGDTMGDWFASSNKSQTQRRTHSAQRVG